MHELTACSGAPWHAQAGIEHELASRAGTAVGLTRAHASPLGGLDPLDLLRPECCVLPLFGRADELAALESWLGGAAPVSIRQLVGRAGIGKTRLALELCRRAEAYGWSAGFVALEAIAEVPANPPHLWPGDALLAVIDCADPYDELASQFCARFAHGCPPGRKRRLLLLSRDPTGRAALRAAPVSAGGLAEVAESIDLSGLRAPADRSALLGWVMAAAARLAGLPPCSPPPSAALDTGEPLHLMLAGLVAPHQGVAAALARSSAALAEELAAAERTKLEQFSYRQRLDPGLVRHLVACITLQDGCSIDAAPGLVQQEADAMGMHLPEPAEHIADYLADTLLVEDDEALQPLDPAPIGEAFLTLELTRHAPEQQAAIIDRALRRDCAATRVTLRRLAELHSDNDSTHPAAAWSCQADA